MKWIIKTRTEKNFSICVKQKGALPVPHHSRNLIGLSFADKKMTAFPLKDSDCTMKNQFLYYIRISKGEQKSITLWPNKRISRNLFRTFLASLKNSKLILK